VLLVAAGVASAADWPHWRGPQRTGITAERSGWSGGAWPARQPAWSVNVGEGSTSPIVVGDRLYTLGWRGGQDHVVCLEAATGKPLWEQAYPAPQFGRHAVGDQNFYSGVSATPEYDPATGFLYTLGVDGELRCWNARDGGKPVWKLNLYERFAVPRRPQATRRPGTQRDYGYTAAPLLHADWIVVEVGDDEGTLMAFDKRTGERCWASEAKGPAGHSAGLVPMTVEGVPCVAAYTLHGLLVARLDPGHAGKTGADVEWLTDFTNNIPTPAVQGSSILVTSKYNQQKIARFDVTLAGARKVWEQRYASGVCSPVIYQGHVYFANHGLHCLDFATGALKWQGGRFGDVASCLVTGDGKIVVWANGGDLALAETAERSADAYKELAFIPGQGAVEVWPHIVLAEGRLYCKDRAGNLKCLPVK
jgi:outer membrane protein assembly factor BamB